MSEPTPVALVTGGAVRVGRAICSALGAAGYDVAVNYRSSAEAAESLAAELRERGRRAVALQADITRSDERDALVDGVERELGPIDLLVNNAALFERRPFLEADTEHWSAHLRLNLEAPFHLSRRVGAAMWQREGGRIVNICGTAGIEPKGDYVAYCVAKSGLDTLTRCCAAALAPRVQVNGVAPGAILFPEGTALAEQERVISRVPAGHRGEPADVAAAVLFFAQAPAYVTGAILPVDGGASVASG